VTGNRFDP